MVEKETTTETPVEEAPATSGILGVDDPKPTVVDEVERAMVEAAEGAEVTVPEETKEPATEPEPTPVEGVPQMTLDEYTNMRERAEAMAFIEPHDDIMKALSN